jgi:hypothetical protein
VRSGGGVKVRERGEEMREERSARGVDGAGPQDEVRDSLDSEPAGSVVPVKTGRRQSLTA